jgi:hypothetical protein
MQHEEQDAVRLGQVADRSAGGGAGRFAEKQRIIVNSQEREKDINREINIYSNK